MKNTLYTVYIEVYDKDDKLFKHPKGTGMFSGFKFKQVYPNEIHAEHDFREIHSGLKMLMPENKFNIEARYFDDTSKTLPLAYSFYGEENRFIKYQ